VESLVLNAQPAPAGVGGLAVPASNLGATLNSVNSSKNIHPIRSPDLRHGHMRFFADKNVNSTSMGTRQWRQTSVEVIVSDQLSYSTTLAQVLQAGFAEDHKVTRASATARRNGGWFAA